MKKGLLFLVISFISFIGMPHESFAQDACYEQGKKIEKEISQLKNHPWAGEYHAFTNTFSVAPRAGFFLFRGSDVLFNSTCAWGSVEWSNGTLKLSPDISNKIESYRGFSTEFIPVVWGERHYLIPTDGVLDFVNAVNNGYEPSSNLSFEGGFFYKKAGDNKKSVSGMPDVPVQFREYLLKEPIRAKVIAIGDYRIETEDSGKLQIRITTITLNVGKKNGVKVGMNFLTYSPSRVHEDAVITKVGENQSEAIIKQEGVIYHVPSIKWKFSTSTHDIK